MFNRIINPLIRSLPYRHGNVLASTKRLVSYEGAPPPVTMDDMPVPCGSWETQHKADQSKYNMHLAVGVIFTAVTLIVAKASGLVYLNYSPPAMPASRE